MRFGINKVLDNCKIIRRFDGFFLRKFFLESDNEKDEFQDDNFDKLYEELQNHLLPTFGQKVLILQPSRSHGKLYLKCGTVEQSCLEARALVNTLRSWTLIDEVKANTRIVHSKTFFSSGNYEKLTTEIRNRKDITAVFLNWKKLSSLQITTLEKDWKKIIYDRYMMVLQIFKLHANTAEAKLHVQLAELPYFRSRMYGFHIQSHSEVILNHLEKSFNGLGLLNSSIKDKYFILKEREHKIKAKLEDIESKRDVLRLNRKKYTFPVISVLGYTNAGKTALIRLLTKDEKVSPRNCFFATLDITYHDFYMKLNENDFGMKTLLIDTIGFMSDIPTELISAFKCTLKDTLEADLLIHVVDVSNEYWKDQMNFTLSTIKSFKLPENLMNSIITVGTKTDLISQSEVVKIQKEIPNFIPVSNKTGENLNLLHSFLSEALQKNVKFIVKRLKVDHGSKIFQWIHSNAVIQNQDVSADGNMLLLEVIFVPSTWAKFQHIFRQVR